MKWKGIYYVTYLRLPSRIEMEGLVSEFLRGLFEGFARFRNFAEVDPRSFAVSRNLKVSQNRPVYLGPKEVTSEETLTHWLVVSLMRRLGKCKGCG